MIRAIESENILAFYNEGMDIIIEFPTEPDKELIESVKQIVKQSEDYAYVDQVQRIVDKLDEDMLRYSLYTIRQRRF